MIDYKVIYKYSCAADILTSKKQEECLHGVRAGYWPADCAPMLYIKAEGEMSQGTRARRDTNKVRLLVRLYTLITFSNWST